MNKEIIVGVKIGEEKWIKSLRNGTAYFNCVEKFIKLGDENDNDEQGDRFEGIFARIKHYDERIDRLKKKLGDDLEFINDKDDFVILRRKSARTVRVFCMYGVMKNELRVINSSVYEKNKIQYGKAKYEFPPEMFGGDFSNKSSSWGFYTNFSRFEKNLNCALDRKQCTYVCDSIIYDIDLNTSFYIEPDDNYFELNHKRTKFEYQHEIRYRIIHYAKNGPIHIKYKPVKKDCCGILEGIHYCVMNCEVKEVKDNGKIDSR